MSIARTVSLLLLGIALSAPARAQSVAPSSGSTVSLVAGPREQSARRMKIAGVVLTSIGIAVGAAAIGASIEVGTRHCSGSRCDQGKALELGTAWGSTLLFLAPGIPLWVVGGQRLAEARSRVALAPISDGRSMVGASLALTF